MRKIKDLCTMTVDNTFRSFPIDDERYELIAVVREAALALVLGADPTFELCLKERFGTFLRQVDENFQRGAEAYVRVRTSADPVPLVVEDRAARVNSSLPRCHPLTYWELDDAENAVLDTRAALWLEYYVRLAAESGARIVSWFPTKTKE